MQIAIFFLGIFWVVECLTKSGFTITNWNPIVKKIKKRPTLFSLINENGKSFALFKKNFSPLLNNRTTYDKGQFIFGAGSLYLRILYSLHIGLLAY
jgi:hypothetical protein